MSEGFKQPLGEGIPPLAYETRLTVLGETRALSLTPAFAESWNVTGLLRWVKRQRPDSDIDGVIYGETTYTVLQQLWISSTGKEEWRDVPVERDTEGKT